MKRPFSFAVPLLAVLGWQLWDSGKGRPGGSGAPAPVSVTWQGSPPTLTVTDGEQIFKKAFWRRSSPEDEILHAVRHEWSDAAGLQRWQWFLVVKASPGLIDYLRDQNAFGLVTGTSVLESPGAPSWFRFEPEEVTMLQAPHSGMRLMFSKNDTVVYATASGLGFTRGAPEPPPPAPGGPGQGRLPATLPPQSP